MYWITLFSFVFFTALVAVGTWLIVRNKEVKSQEGYFLAGRSLTFPFIAGSLLLTNLSTEQMVGLNGSAYAEGFIVMAWEVLAVIALVIMSWFFLPRFLNAGVTTVPEYLAKRFDKSTGTICNAIFLIAYTFGLLPIILYTGATGLNGILDMKSLTGIHNESVLLWCMIWFIGIAGSIYALFGGLRSVAVSDLLNGIGLLVGGFMICFFALKVAGNGEGLMAGLENVYHFEPSRFNSIGSQNSSIPFSTLFTGVLIINLFYWCTNQQIIQRTFGASSLAEGQKGILLCGALKLLGPLYLVLPGMIAYYFFSKDGIRPDHAYGMLVSKVLPAPLAGFFAAVMVGAILSSFNSVLNATCTLFSLGFYKQYINPKATELQVVSSGKTFGWTVAVLSMLVAPMLAKTTSIFTYLQYINSMYAIPIFSVVLLSMLSKSIPAGAVKITLVVGCILTILGVMLVKNINPFHVSGVIFLLLVGFMLAARKFNPVPRKMQDASPVDMTPWKLAHPIGTILLGIVLFIFLAFSNF